MVWSNSSTLRASLMAVMDFPLPDDLLAFLLLNQLVYRGGGRASEMAEAIETSTSNVTKVVRRLERAGLITRGPDPVDNRAVIIALTDEGRRAGEKILAELRRVRGTALAPWSEQDRQDFERLTIRYVRDLDAASSSALAAVSGVRHPS